MTIENEIVLKIKGKEFSGWKTLEVNQSIDQLASYFAFEYTEKDWLEQGFAMGDPAVVSLNNNRLLTGYVEEIDKSYTDTSHSLQIRGRDALGDLIDCSFYQEGKSGEWKNLTVKRLIEALIAQFNIQLSVDSSVASALSQTKHSFEVRQGDTIADSLMRLAREFAFLPVSYGDGKLTVTRAGRNRRAVTAIEKGKNVKSGSSLQSNIDRFSVYVVKGSNTGDVLHEIASYTAPVAKVIDSLIERHRPLVIIHEDKTTTAKCKDRAKWESMIRAGKSRSFNYKVQGWLQEDGTPWPVNAMYHIRDDVLNVNGEYLCNQLSFRLDSDGANTSFSFVDRDTYELIEQPEKISGDNDSLLREIIRR